MRSRTHSWSNVDKKFGLASSLTTASSAKTHHQRQHSAQLMDQRQRTTSEGNSHFELGKKMIRAGKSITSGSPMSPGSFISSESAGSSNSLDDTETVDNRMVTPIDDYVGPATIFEEVTNTFGAKIQLLKSEKKKYFSALEILKRSFWCEYSNF